MLNKNNSHDFTYIIAENDHHYLIHNAKNTYIMVNEYEVELNGDIGLEGDISNYDEFLKKVGCFRQPYILEKN